MRNLVLAGAVALAMAGTSFVVTPASAQQIASLSGVSDSQIGQFKSVLNLTAEQEAHWPAVESALRQMRNARFDALGIKRVLSAARPLIKSLDENQKRTAMRVAQSMGLSSYAASIF
jgi:hypothetical protein